MSLVGAALVARRLAMVTKRPFTVKLDTAACFIRIQAIRPIRASRNRGQYVSVAAKRHEVKNPVVASDSKERSLLMRMFYYILVLCTLIATSVTAFAKNENLQCYEAEIDFSNLDKISKINIFLSDSNERSTDIFFSTSRGKYINAVACPLLAPGLCVLEDDGGEFKISKYSKDEVTIEINGEPGLRMDDNGEPTPFIRILAKNQKKRTLKLNKAKPGNCQL